MKNLFTKLLMFAAVAGVFAACDKDKDKDYENYMELGGKKTGISFVGTEGSGASSGMPEESRLFLIAGEGIVLKDNNSNVPPTGIGNVVQVLAGAEPGVYVGNLTGNGTGVGVSVNQDFSKNPSDEGYREAQGTLEDGSKIKWAKSGSTYTIEIDGIWKNGADQSTKPFKLRYSGKVVEALSDQQ